MRVQEKRSKNQNTQTLNQMNRKGHTNTALISVSVRIGALGQVGILGAGWETGADHTKYLHLIKSA